MLLLLNQQTSLFHCSNELYFCPGDILYVAANNRTKTLLCSLEMSLNPQPNKRTIYNILKGFELLSKAVFVSFYNTPGANLLAKEGGLKPRGWYLCIKDFRNILGWKCDNAAPNSWCLVLRGDLKTKQNKTNTEGKNYLKHLKSTILLGCSVWTSAEIKLETPGIFTALHIHRWTGAYHMPESFRS